ncbi:MAG: hypothetical protein LUG44_03055 [Clostridiales bacterium]|nr:hypothetical protein [Clostridiales bacterium]
MINTNVLNSFNLSRRGQLKEAYIILDKNIDELGKHIVSIDSTVDSFLLYSDRVDSAVYMKAAPLHKSNEPLYLIIRNIDFISLEEQKKYINLVATRIIWQGNSEAKPMCENVAIVFTVSNKKAHITPDLRMFCTILDTDLYHSNI